MIIVYIGQGNYNFTLYTLLFCEHTVTVPKFMNYNWLSKLKNQMFVGQSVKLLNYSELSSSKIHCENTFYHYNASEGILCHTKFLVTQFFPVTFK